jgi:hypothetical protein
MESSGMTMVRVICGRPNETNTLAVGDDDQQITILGHRFAFLRTPLRGRKLELARGLH